MSRTVLLHLLFAWLPLLMSLLLAHDPGGFNMILRWIGIQLACWAGALTLLRWRIGLFVPAFLAFCHSVVCFIAAALASSHGTQVADRIAILGLLKFVIVAFLMLMLRFHSTLVNLDEVRPRILPAIPLQFRLSWLFAVTTMIAIGAMIAYSMQHKQREWEELILVLLQAAAWMITADQLLQPRVRWMFVVALTCLMLGGWMLFLEYYRAGYSYLRNDWSRMQSMIFLVALAYRWAGWRIVPRETAEHLLNYPPAIVTPGLELEEALASGQSSYVS